MSSDGTILYAAAEERFTKRKLQKGNPRHAAHDARTHLNGTHERLAYVDLPLWRKAARNALLLARSFHHARNTVKSAENLTATLLARFSRGRYSGVIGTDAVADMPAYDALCEHHTAHAASAYYCSGFDHAHVVTVDGVGDCLSAAVFQARAGRLRPIRRFFYNDFTVGADYECLTAMLGFHPDRHCGKITGLAAYGRKNDACIQAVRAFFEHTWRRGQLNYFDRIHGPQSAKWLSELCSVRARIFESFSREDLAYAMQHLAERRVLSLIRDNVPEIRNRNVALAGGVFANVRINQKVKQLGFANVFVQPAMDDGGLSLGAALYDLARRRGVKPKRLPHVFLGSGFSDDEIAEALQRAGIEYRRVDHLAYAVARLIADGKVVARFAGRMEFGPRALGNRSILYETLDPSVNSWLNKRLGRTEFMPFAPATLAEHADRCYHGLDGCRHAAEFMTITFDCTNEMRRMSPAVVHVDGTARAQLVTREANPGLHEIISEYHRLTAIPSVVNTSFNMHESPIVRTPDDAIRTFRQGHLDALAIGPFLAQAIEQRVAADTAAARACAGAPA